MGETEIETLRKYLEEAGKIDFEEEKKIVSEFGEIEFYRSVVSGPTVAYIPNGWEETYQDRFTEYCSRISDAIEELGYEGKLNIEKTFEGGNTKQILNFTTKGPYAIEINNKEITIHNEEGIKLSEYLI
ncbi:MAG: hypothetical protein KAT28_05345 [Candidatus Aenigmarchaeota archaeon]|nr:hypothetical protein [Candidatus Aenigmarchaeota archaeon]